MTKDFVWGIAGLICLCTVVNGQGTDRSANLGSLQYSTPSAPSLRLSDGRMFPFGSPFAWMAAPNDFLPDWKPEGWDNSDRNLAQNSPGRRQKGDSKSVASYSKDTSTESVTLHKQLWENVHGEVGFLYGRSVGGRVSQDIESGYIFGTVGDEKLQISVGASYERSNYSFDRRGR